MIKACVFDAYGTLFDVGAAARIAAGEPGAEGWAGKWPQIAADWRRKQLEYTWLRAVAGAHADFWRVTQDGLDWALENAGLSDTGLRSRLLQLYWDLAAFPEVPAMLVALAAQGQRLAILSNGSPGMLDGAVRSAGLGGVFEGLFSVESVGVFKPDRRVYELVGAGLKLAPQEVLFVSSNGWDACAGAAYGFATVWVNRDGAPRDRLFGSPQHVLSDLAALPGLVESL
ncbi:haloacid dehalogenase type II [Pararhodobacter zhoushanensis]|uniref:(S)-2-haloacid dehalogenase n=1 Tax=Pararhodobacter zhoushanensis TaxID=2479545 RepID=A0ABT3GTU9_9RHOB|nr:haloacid dehalogenase type II [Pararhodobacter zhoushanensis]MCW1930978.1 haloacid dehalogenase type II [Pararhodobacter zhoushanensis]